MPDPAVETVRVLQLGDKLYQHLCYSLGQYSSLPGCNEQLLMRLLDKLDRNPEAPRISPEEAEMCATALETFNEEGLEDEALIRSGAAYIRGLFDSTES